MVYYFDVKYRNWALVLLRMTGMEWSMEHEMRWDNILIIK